MSFQSLLRSVFTSAALLYSSTVSGQPALPPSSSELEASQVTEGSDVPAEVQKLTPRECTTDLRPTEDTAYRIITGEGTLRNSNCLRTLQLSLILWELTQDGDKIRAVSNRSGITGRPDAPTIQRLTRFLREVDDPESFVTGNRPLLDFLKQNMRRDAYIAFLEHMVTSTLPDRAGALSSTLINAHTDSYMLCVQNAVNSDLLNETGSIPLDQETLEEARELKDPTLIVGDPCEHYLETLHPDLQADARAGAVEEAIHIIEGFNESRNPAYDGHRLETDVQFRPSPPSTLNPALTITP